MSDSPECEYRFLDVDERVLAAVSRSLEWEYLQASLDIFKPPILSLTKWKLLICYRYLTGTMVILELLAFHDALLVI